MEFSKTYTGERSEYFSKNKEYSRVSFKDGESCLKHSEGASVMDSSFEWKYPLWNSCDTAVKSSVFHPMAKSGLWYTKNTRIEDTLIEAPKEFRRCNGIFLKNVEFTDAQETLWSCKNISLLNVKAKGDYFAMNSSNFTAENFTLDGNYFLDGGKNIEIRNAVLNSKDAFWNCQNVTVYDSTIIGEYLGWYSKNLKFVNCRIESDQGLCYIDGLTLENCTLLNSPLTFEYSKKIKAEIKGYIESVKNPGSGTISAEEIGTLILNPARCNPKKIKVICPNIHTSLSQDPNPNER